MTVTRITTSRTDIPAGDYVSEGLSIVMPDSCFPNMIVGDKANHPWPYLRREISHNWYCDRRAPEVGFLNRDEAILLYNLALPFREKPALEIGSWMGWSTCHLALAGLALDVMDPVLENPEHASSVRESLTAAGVLSGVRLYTMASPDGIREIAKLTGTKWSFFFIDGDHESPGPERDARACLEHAAKDAMIVFHDLASPDVEAGLQVLWRQGWQVLIYQTMQIMGVAWRGDVMPVTHKPDPSVAWLLPLHLVKYTVSGSPPGDDARRLSEGIAFRDQEIERLRVELTSAGTEIERARTELGARDAWFKTQEEKLSYFESQLRTQEAELATRDAQFKTQEEKLSYFESQLRTQEAELAARADKLVQLEEQTQTREAELVHLRGALTARESYQVQTQEAELAHLRGALTAREADVVARDNEIQRLTAGMNRSTQEIQRLSTEVSKIQQALAAVQSSVSWKVTRPLRAMKRVVRFLRSAPRRLASSIRGEMKSLGPDTPRLRRIVKATRTIVPRLSRRAAWSLGSFFSDRYAFREAITLITGSGLFDATFYRERYPDVAQAGVNPLMHYLSNGAAEGRDPHPLFDSSFYYETYPDVAQAGVNPLAHYLSNGAAEGRDPHPLFDTSFYLEQKPQVGELGINPLVHFLAEGPTADFDPLSPAPRLPETGICIVTPDIVGPVKNGGIGTACYHFARVLAEADHPVSVFFTGDVTDCQKAHWRNTYARMRINFIALSDAPPVTGFVYGSTWFLERSWRVFEYLRKAQFSAVHFQDWQANGFWSIKAKQTGLALPQTTLTVMTHSCTKWINEGMQQFSANPFETAKLVWAEIYCMEHCDLLLSPSRYMHQWVSDNQIHVPPRTLLTPYAWANGSSDVVPVGGPVDSDHLIFFGRLETRKGLHVLGEALRLLQRGGAALPRAVSFLGKHASVLGQPSSEYLEELRRDISTTQIRVINDFDYVQALNYIRQTKGLVIIPSIIDNYPLTVIECIQNGIPFIAATTGGIPEMIDPEVSFEPDAASLASRLKTRDAIDHGNLKHKYSASLAATIWRDLHVELRAVSAERGTRVPNQDTGRPKSVSVCIPFFNHQRYLESLITSFARQSYPVFEVIVVNDGSCPEASREFERVASRNRDRRFRFLTVENCGPGAARNFAAEQVTGELLLFFDADNLPKGNDFIRTLVRALEYSNADCVTCPYDVVSADKIFVSERDVLATYRPIGACVEAGFFENTFGDATMIIRRSVFDELGQFPTRRASWEDHELLLNLCFKGYRLETFPKALFYYRQNLNGRHRQANDFRNYQSLFGQLQVAPSGDLARIITAISGPMLAGRPGTSTARLVSQG